MGGGYRRIGIGETAIALPSLRYSVLCDCDCIGSTLHVIVIALALPFKREHSCANLQYLGTNRWMGRVVVSTSCGLGIYRNRTLP